jgi:hypothetical protein
MALMSMLETAQGGSLFATAAKALGLSADDTRAAMTAICPAIAEKLRDKAEQDADTYDTLLDLLDDNAGGGSLEDPEALTGAEAVSDGNAMLEDIYGSRNAAIVALRQLAPAISESALPKLAALSATAVLMVIAAGPGTPAPLVGAQAAADTGGGGILGTIVSAVVKGLMEGAQRSLAPKRRRRRGYSGYFGKRRTTRKTTRKTTRRRKTGTTLEDIFGEILGTRRR